ncbi:MAG: hypothetical protein QGG48_07290, partial [Desulfatiglandales bacterium]|nr:hypothetical protein [Desulfatiglandales bacterium]
PPDNILAFLNIFHYGAVFTSTGDTGLIPFSLPRHVLTWSNQLLSGDRPSARAVSLLDLGIGCGL